MMRKIEIVTARDVRANHVVCPHCNSLGDDALEDCEPGIYECTMCDGSFEVTQATLAAYSSVKSHSRIDELEKRIKRLEKELGIK
jgi:hypothetical protein